MALLLFIVINLVLMTTLFLFGVYQFMQVEEKRKCNQLLLDSRVDFDDLQSLLRQDRYEEARQRLVSVAEVDPFTAESVLEQLMRQNQQNLKNCVGC